MFNVKLKRKLKKCDYDALSWMSLYACGERYYDESKILRAAEVVEELVEDEGGAYSKWIINVANGKQFDWHRLQSFCIELMETYQEQR